MPKVELDLTTSIPPERVRSALLDFSKRRPEIWPGIEPSLYEVYAVGETSAEVQEGSQMPGTRIWAKEHYDWSEPGVVRWTVRESNFCAPGSSVEARITPDDVGGSRIHITWDRRPTSITAAIATAMIVLTRGAPVAASFRTAMERLEADTSATSQT